MSATHVRITVAEALARLQPLIGAAQPLVRNRNKGLAGHLLETLLSIPHSSACLDCADGELKAFPLKRLANGQLVPKETVAVTMLHGTVLTDTWATSRPGEKLRNTLFVPYLWTETELTFYRPACFSAEHPLWSALEYDYMVIQENGRAGQFTGSIGRYLQTRTKGAGHGSKSRAFYLRTGFLKELFPEGFSVQAQAQTQL